VEAFGSVVYGVSNPDSDLDLCVLVGGVVSSFILAKLKVF
jgi:predicted nucleotidyltransferase